MDFITLAKNRYSVRSYSEKQIERIRAIFEDRGETIAFTAVNRTLHEGFIDHSLRCCFLTDHSIDHQQNFIWLC